MWEAEIISPWGVNAEGTNIPQIELDHPVVQRGEYWSESHGGYGSGQSGTTPPLDPNLCIIYARFTAAHIDAILADTDYGEGAFLWLEEITREGF